MHPVQTHKLLLSHNDNWRCTFPKISSGKPVNAIILLRSEVFNEVGRVNVGALFASGGDPASSSVCSNPGSNVTNEYWKVHNFSTGWP